jgi:hypothetical protein
MLIIENIILKKLIGSKITSIQVYKGQMGKWLFFQKKTN